MSDRQLAESGDMRPTTAFSQQDIEFHRQTARQYDDETTRQYGIYHRYSLYPYLDRLVTSGEVRLALDLGSGTGVVALAMASRGISVRAFDHSPEMLSIARAKAEAAGLDARIDFQTGDVTSLNVSDASQDLVTCQGLLHHLADMGPVVREVQRVLRPGGHFYFSEPTVDLTPVGIVLKRAARVINRVRRIPPHPESVEAPIRTVDLERLISECGLEYRAEYLSHVPYASRLMPDPARIRLTILLSWPWRHTRGDLVFITGRKPSA